MGYEKLVEGNNEFCKVSKTSIVMKTKAQLEKEKKDLEKQFKAVEEAYNEGLADINAQLAVFEG